MPAPAGTPSGKPGPFAKVLAVERTRLYIACFWIGLGVLGIVIALALGITVFGFIGPVAALGYGIFDLTRLLRS